MALFRKLRKRFHRDSTANMHPSRREAEHVRIPRMEAILRKNPTAVHVKVSKVHRFAKQQLLNQYN